MDERLTIESGFAREQLLAALILAFRPPTRESLDQLRRVDFGLLTDAAGLDRPELSLAESSEMPLGELESEYVRLFVNARHGEVAHLEALAYLVEDGEEAQGAELLELARSLAAAGLEPTDSSVFPADHLTVLLEALLSMEETADAPLGQHPFAVRFLHGWVPEMLGRLENAGPHRFYRAAGELLARMLGLSADEQRKQEPIRTPE